MFADKRFQSKMLSENYPVKVYIIDELLRHTFELIERLEAPIEQYPKYKTLKKNQIDQYDKAQEEIKYAEIKQIA